MEASRSSRNEKKKRDRKKALVAGAIVLLVAGGVALAVALGGSDGTEATDEAEASATVDATAADGGADGAGAGETTASDSPTATVETTPTAGGPSYTKFAYIRSVQGSKIVVDFFELLAGAEAQAYAKEHDLTVPGNGILFDNPDEKTTQLPLSPDAAIRYATGGIEALSMVSADADTLKSWAAGDTDAMPGAMTDWWKVTVDGGVVTRIDMLVIAD